MKLTTYIVYDVDTGAAVHLHSEPAGLDTDPDQVRLLADPHGVRNLAVVRAPRDGVPSTPVRVVDGRFEDAGADGGSGGAGGDDGFGEPHDGLRYTAPGG